MLPLYVKVCSVKKDIPSIVKYLCFEELQTKRSCWSFLVQFASLELTRLGRSHLAGVCGKIREYSVAVPCERSVWMLVDSFGGGGGGGRGEDRVKCGPCSHLVCSGENADFTHQDFF